MIQDQSVIFSGDNSSKKKKNPLNSTAGKTSNF